MPYEYTDMSNQFLPYPASVEEIRQYLLEVEKSLLKSDERFIMQQVRKPLSELVSVSREKFALDTLESEWLNIYSIL